MQVILGAGGAIGIELAKALPTYTDQIRLVSRNPQAVNSGDQLMAADLLNPADVKKAIQGAEVAYLTVGYPYQHKIWADVWPRTMDTVIQACKAEGTKLVFFDNIYMYDPDYLNGMTEETPIRPVSKKGRTRAAIAQQLLDETASGSLEALIARSADFYGPSLKTSVLTETVIKNLAQRKAANWLGELRFTHSYTFTPDAGKATALLGNTPSANGQVWHLPTDSTPLNGQQWVEALANALKVPAKVRAVPRWQVRMIGLFVPIMAEMVEMMYQYERDYLFSSQKFDQAFPSFSSTPYSEGIRQIVSHDYGL